MASNPKSAIHDQDMFREEQSLLAEALDMDAASLDHIGYLRLRDGFERLLKKSVKITRLGDRTQKKLIRLMHQLEEKNAQIEHQKQELALYNKKLEEASITDPLTGLRNRRFLLHYMEIGQEEMLRHFASGGTHPDAIFALFDIDHFKHINDSYGHSAGDRVLVQFSKILQDTSRKSDVIVRWGGEEFLVIMRQLNRQEGKDLAEKFRRRIENQDFDIGERTIRCTVSIGFAPYPFFPGAVKALSWEKALDLADQGLYVAKRSSRNAWVGVMPRIGQPPEGDDDYRSLAEGISSLTLNLETSFPADRTAMH